MGVVSPANFVPVSRCSPFFDVQSFDDDEGESDMNTISLGADAEATMSDSATSSTSTAASSITKSRWRLDLNEILKEHKTAKREQEANDVKNVIAALTSVTKESSQVDEEVGSDPSSASSHTEGKTGTTATTKKKQPPAPVSRRNSKRKRTTSVGPAT